jgi:superfamily II DNA or RNA helicase
MRYQALGGVVRILRFDRGTLLLEGFPDEEVPPSFRKDARVGMWRAPAIAYHQVALDLHKRGIPYDDQARAYGPLNREHRSERTPRDYQREAVAAWRAAGRRGTVVLPTGAGKSFVAELAIALCDRSALVVAPTLDLVGQWYDGLRRAFGDPVGIVGGGVHEVHDITVTTYDSAYIHVERYGARFGLVVFDEVHHLPGATYSQAAEGSLAPFRLGLTATLEREDGGEERVESLIGPVVYRKGIRDLSGEFLASYQTEVLEVSLSQEERAAHDGAMALYRSFRESRGIGGGRSGWNHFLREAARSSEGRKAHRAWLDARRILQGNQAKLQRLEELLRQHASDRVLVFTNDNATVYKLSRQLLLPAITHQTDLKERSRLLQDFSDGTLPVLVTSRVLNEGVDLPAADVAIVLSGTSTVREHVQRLGRILRPQADKHAILYEIVVEESAEQRTSRLRREHDAYRPDA